MHPLFRGILLLAMGLLLFACSRDEKPLLRIGTEEISRAEFRQELLPLRDELTQLQPEQQKLLLRQALSQLIDRQLLQTEALRRGISVSEAEIQQAMSDLRGNFSNTEYREMLVRSGQDPDRWQEQLRTRLLNEKVASRIARDQVKITEQEVEEYYLQHLAEYRHPEQLQARQMLLKSKEEANELRNRLLAGAPFAELAREHSLSPDRETGGDLGLFSRGQLPPEFDKVLFELTPGRVSLPVKTPYGIHLFLVEKRLKAGVLPREEVSEAIRVSLRKKKETELYLHWLQELRENSEIQIDWEQLDKFNFGRAE